MNCRQCDSRLGAEARFCAHCGASVAQTASTQDRWLDSSASTSGPADPGRYAEPGPRLAPGLQWLLALVLVLGVAAAAWQALQPRRIPTFGGEVPLGTKAQLLADDKVKAGSIVGPVEVQELALVPPPPAAPPPVLTVAPLVEQPRVLPVASVEVGAPRAATPVATVRRTPSLSDLID